MLVWIVPVAVTTAGSDRCGPTRVATCFRGLGPRPRGPEILAALCAIGDGAGVSDVDPTACGSLSTGY